MYYKYIKWINFTYTTLSNGGIQVKPKNTCNAKNKFKIQSYDNFLFTQDGKVEVRFRTDNLKKETFQIWNIIFDTSVIINQISKVSPVGLSPDKLADIKSLVKYVSKEAQQWYNGVFEEISKIKHKKSSHQETTNKNGKNKEIEVGNKEKKIKKLKRKENSVETKKNF